MKLSYFCSFILCLFTTSGCQKKPEQSRVEVAIEVSVYTVEPKSIPIDYSFVGVIESSHQVQIRSGVAGELEEIAYTEGAFVNKGDLLFKIDPRRYQAAVKEAEANLEAQQASLTQAQETVSRLKPLFIQKAVSKKDLEDAIANLLTAQANVNNYKAKLDEANLDLGDTLITSPISGFTSVAGFQEGSLISPNSNQFLATVSALDPIYVSLSSSEGVYLMNLEEVAKGELIYPGNDSFEVTLTLSNGLDFPLKGKVSFVSPVFNVETGTLISRAIFPNPQYFLKPGLFVNATVHGAFRPNAIIVPQEAVQQGMGGHFVYIIDEEKRVEIRPVVVGDWYKEYWVIKSGLKKGERVLTSGITKVRNGTLVKIKKGP